MSSSFLRSRGFRQSGINAQSGLSMIEVLVALLILSIGLLGLAALQLTAAQMTTQSLQKTQAILLAQDAVERVRANRNNADSYGLTVDQDQDCDESFTPNGGSVQARDQAEWENNVRCLLANGGGSLTVQNSPDRVVVNITWNSRIEDEPGSLNMTARY